MKRPLLVYLMLLCFNLIFVNNSIAALDNILQNPGFENSGWPPANWSEWQGAASGKPTDGVAGYISNTVFHTGSQSVGRKLYGSGIRWGGYSQDVTLRPGESVTISGWLMSPSSDGPLRSGAQAYIELKFFGADNNELAVYKSSPLKSASSWVKHTITQSAPGNTATARFSFVLYASGTSSSGQVYFDDAAILVDRTPPVVKLISPPNGSTLAASYIPVVGTIDDSSINTIYLNGNAVGCFEGKWETHLTVVNGANTLTVTATDSTGNVGTDTSAITYDPLAATGLFNIIYPTNGDIVTENSALVTATLTNPPDLYININGKEYLTTKGALIAHVPISAGSNVLTFRCHNKAGSEDVKILNIIFDTTDVSFGGVIANNGFEDNGYPQKEWIRWSGKQSPPTVTTDGSQSFISTTIKHAGLQSSGQKLFGRTFRWGGLSQEFPVIPGDTINASGWLASFRGNDPLLRGALAWVEMKYLSSFGNEIIKYPSSKVTAATNGWVQRSVSSVVPDGAVIGVFNFVQTGPDGASGTVYFDDASVQIIPGNHTPPTKNPFPKPQSTGPVQISGNSILVNGSPFKIKGVCYQPTPIGSVPWLYDIYSDSNIYNRDLLLLRSMGANVVRTYAKVTSTGFLDACYNGGVNPIYVIMGFYIDGSSDLSDPTVRASIKTDFQNYIYMYKNHPAVLMWSPGNETELAYAASDRDLYTLLNELAQVAYLEEGSAYHPVTAIVGNVSPIGDNGLLTSDNDMDYIDVWGGNVYEGITFGDMFDDVVYRTRKPYWVSEFGVDAWHTNDKYSDPSVGYVDEASQSQWDVILWDEIALRGDVCSGGTVFEYSDEWWKDSSGTNSAHDYGSFYYAYMPSAHPDEYSNEEWYGVVAVSKSATGSDTITLRQAFNALKSRWANP